MQVELTTRGADLWTEGVALVDRIYKTSYGAKIPAHADELVVVRATDKGGDAVVVAAAGLREASTGLFSQAYLDTPAHLAASRALGRPVDKHEIIEVVTFASVSPAAVMSLVTQGVRFGRERGKVVSLFTATSRLRRLLRATCLPLVDMGPADPARIENVETWGRYYATDPRVCLIPDPEVFSAGRIKREVA